MGVDALIPPFAMARRPKRGAPAVVQSVKIQNRFFYLFEIRHR